MDLWSIDVYCENHKLLSPRMSLNNMFLFDSDGKLLVLVVPTVGISDQEWGMLHWHTWRWEGGQGLCRGSFHVFPWLKLSFWVVYFGKTRLNGKGPEKWYGVMSEQRVLIWCRSGKETGDYPTWRNSGLNMSKCLIFGYSSGRSPTWGWRSILRQRTGHEFPIGLLQAMIGTFRKSNTASESPIHVYVYIYINVIYIYIQ